jgi:hypothetical protein
MFSTAMIASSTSAPIAIAMPPRVMVLMLLPSACRTRTAVSSESGSATSVIRLARALKRKATTTSPTIAAPSSRARVVLRVEFSMKTACRKSCLLMCIPSGSVVCSSSSTLSRRAVSSSVFAPGCFWMATITPGSMIGSQFGPRRDEEPMPRFSAAPMATVPRSETRTGTPLRRAITVLAMSSVERIRPMPSTIASCAPSISTPAARFSFVPSSAPTTSSAAISKARRRAGESTTWYCFSSPPIGVTCETPATERMRLRTCVTAVVRSSSWLWRSEVSETNRISPMIEETGAIVGASTSAGRLPPTAPRRSVTVWRAR